MSGRRFSTGAVVLALVVLGPVDAGEAAFPGENGRLALTWTTEPYEVTTDSLATMDPETGQFSTLVTCEYECHHESAEWSPDGSRIVYVDEQPDAADSIVSIDPDGSNRSVIFRAPPDGFLEAPAWSPDGRRIAFVQYRWPKGGDGYTGDIFIIRRDGARLRRITRDAAAESDLDWSSKGRLAFVRAPDRGRVRRQDLFTVRPDGTSLRRLTDTDVAEWAPDWAPGGRRITYFRGRYDFFERIGSEVWVIKPTGEGASLLTEGHSPAWAPDGSAIAFVDRDGAIYTIDPAGKNPAMLAGPVSEGWIGELDWQAIP